MEDYYRSLVWFNRMLWIGIVLILIDVVLFLECLYV